jgi:hypothetical protein
MWATFAYVAVLPLLFHAGFRDPIYPIAMTSLVALNLGLLWWRSRAAQGAVAIILAVVLLIAMLGRMFSPFLVAPGLAAVSGVTIMFGLVPATARAAVAMIAVLVGAVLLPWLAEAGGLVSSTIGHTARALVLETPGLQTRTTTSIALLIGYTVLLVAAAVLIATQLRRSEVRARGHLHLQAWQLRQLVPAPPIA